MTAKSHTMAVPSNEDVRRYRLFRDQLTISKPKLLDAPQPPDSFHMSLQNAYSTSTLDIPYLHKTVRAPRGEVMPRKWTGRVELYADSL